MRNAILAATSIALFLPMSARADIPPPPELYTGPSSATVAGLTFEHEESAPTGAVILASCTNGSANCTLVTKAGAIGGIVWKVADVYVQGNVAAVESAFAKAGNTSVVLEITAPNTDGGNRVISLTVSAH